MEILAIIPARGGSKGIPNKNIKMLAGHPLIFYSIEAGLKSKYVTRTVLSTEAENIKKVALECSCEVIDRPMELAQDTTMTIPVLIHVLDYLKEKEGYEPDAVVLLQPTCPLRDSVELDNVLACYFEGLKKGHDSAFAVLDIGITHSLWRQIPNTEKFEPLYDSRTRPRRQDEHRHYPMFRETGSVYVVKTDVMRKVNDFIGENPTVYVVNESIDIDTPDDFESIAKILEKRNKQ